MDSIWFLVVILLAVYYILSLKPSKKKRARDNKKATPPRVYPDVTQWDFVLIAKHAAKGIKRITNIQITGANVYGTVISQSGLSEWVFELHFGYIGQLTGEYDYYSENADSDIPEVLGDQIQAAIRSFPNTTLDSNDCYAFCPYCGKRLPKPIGSFCTFCGKAFM